MRLLNPLRFLTLPLLTKELIEQAARKRTYIIRVAYAVPLFFTAMLVLYSFKQQSQYNPLAILGQGREIFEMLVYTQFVGVCIFLPAMMASAIAYEKERNSLMLVFLTDMRPWEILIQKFMGRVLPMLTFLLLALPLMAVAYALGGLTPNRVWSGVYLLLVMVLQVGTLSLMLSCFCRSTVAAFIGSYLLGVLFYFGGFLLWALLSCLQPYRLNYYARMGYPNYRWRQDIVFCWFPPYIFANTQTRPFRDVVLRSIPSLLWALFFLLLARVFLVRRAFVSPRNFLLGIFRFFDRIATSANRLTGGVVLIKDRAGLPDDKPVAWREVTKRALGKPHYLLRILLVLEVPVGVITVIFATMSATGSSGEVLSMLLFFLWPIALLVLTVQAANTMVAERTHQTMEVLMTTPLTGREIVEQKTAAVRRLVAILVIPLLTIIATEAWWKWAWRNNNYYGYVNNPLYFSDEIGFSHNAIYIICSLFSLIIYLPLTAWFSLWIGLRMKTQARAIIAAVGALTAWIVVPVIVIVVTQDVLRLHNGVNQHLISYLLLSSPAAILIFNEYNEWRGFGTSPIVPIVLNYAFYGALMYYFRWLCLYRADRYLGRV